MPSFSTTLEQAIHAALALANARRHEFATLEHLLLALLDEPDAVQVMKACSVDVSDLRDTLVEFVDDDLSNLITDIDVELLAGLDDPKVLVAGHQLPLLDTYSNAKPGDYLALINSFGVVEIARSEGNAAEGLGAERGAPVVITT